MITYETTNTHPGALPSATIYMNGLLCLSFDHTNRCTVAVNNRAGREHTWKFSIVDPNSRKSIVDLKQGNLRTPRELSEFYINVKGGTTRGTYVYTGDQVSIPDSTENRYNLERYWVDLEGPRGHNRRVENDANTLWPRFYINEGLFCTSDLTAGEFDLRDTNSKPVIKPLGQIAIGIVADIFLDRNDPQSKIEIKLPNETISLENSRGRYVIDISNDCLSHVGPERSDFHLHYNAFSGAFDKPADRFHLVPHGKETSPDSLVPDVDSYNDRAPCMGTALGQTSAFNK